jgi:nitronate monooxygenase
MAIPAPLLRGLRVPVLASPMFLVSGPELVIASCTAGILGSFPALNHRTSEGFDGWLTQIGDALSAHDASHPEAPSCAFGVNLIVHRTNPRLEADLAVCAQHRVPFVITSLGAVRELVDTVHGWGGLVFHDVTTVRHAKKAAAAGVDGLILVCAGAGGHAGTTSPFALLPEIRSFFSGTILLAGSLSDGRSVAAARMLGADLAYLGTRFIATEEANAPDAYKQMLLASAAADILYTDAISGIAANFLEPSLRQAGLDPAHLPTKHEIDLGTELDTESKAWKDIWSAGQGVGTIHDIPTTRALVDRLVAEYREACETFRP